MFGRPIVVGAVAALAALLTAPAARAQAPAPGRNQWAPAAPPAAPPPGARRGGGPPLVYVTVVADRPDAVLLQQVPAPYGLDTAGGFQGQVGQTSRVQVCKAPCGAYVPAARTYAVGGTGYRQSPGFELTGHYPRIKVAARVGTENALLGGIVLAGAGAFTGLVGLGLLPFAVYKHSTSLEIGAAAALGLGIAGFATGISMASGSETKVELETAAAAPQRRASRAAVRLTPFGFVF